MDVAWAKTHDVFDSSQWTSHQQNMVVRKAKSDLNRARSRVIRQIETLSDQIKTTAQQIKKTEKILKDREKLNDRSKALWLKEKAKQAQLATPLTKGVKFLSVDHSEPCHSNE